MRNVLKNRITCGFLFRFWGVLAVCALFCFAGTIGGTWAWLTTQVSSGSNTIQCAEYTAQLTVKNDVGATVSTENVLVPGAYTVELKLNAQGLDTQDPSAQGYCILTITINGTGHGFYREMSIGGEGCSFTLTVEDDASPSLSAAAAWRQSDAETGANQLPESGLTVTASGLVQTTNTLGATLPTNPSNGQQGTPGTGEGGTAGTGEGGAAGTGEGGATGTGEGGATGAGEGGTAGAGENGAPGAGENGAAGTVESGAAGTDEGGAAEGEQGSAATETT